MPQDIDITIEACATSAHTSRRGSLIDVFGGETSRKVSTFIRNTGRRVISRGALWARGGDGDSDTGRASAASLAEPSSPFTGLRQPRRSEADEENGRQGSVNSAELGRLRAGGR